jgi:hypothetical protein
MNELPLIPEAADGSPQDLIHLGDAVLSLVNLSETLIPIQMAIFSHMSNRHLNQIYRF